MLVTNLDAEERDKFDRELNTGVSDDEAMRRLERRAMELLKADREPAVEVDADWLARHTQSATPEPETEPRQQVTWTRREIRWNYTDGEGG